MSSEEDSPKGGAARHVGSHGVMWGGVSSRRDSTSYKAIRRVTRRVVLVRRRWREMR